jgi:hypothetical protein
MTEYKLDNGTTWVIYTAPFQVTSEGTITTLARSTDAAGNVENPPVAATFKIDTTPPLVAIFEPQAGDYEHSEQLPLQFTVADAVSEVASTAATLDGKEVANGQSISLLSLGLGLHTFVVIATDNAGNPGTQSVTFNIIANPGSLTKAIAELLANGAIDSAGLANSLQQKLDAVQTKLEQGNVKAAGNLLQAFVNELGAQRGKHIAVVAADLLMADARYVIERLGN